jgi:hypothetical protein
VLSGGGQALPQHMGFAPVSRAHRNTNMCATYHIRLLTTLASPPRASQTVRTATKQLYEPWILGWEQRLS